MQYSFQNSFGRGLYNQFEDGFIKQILSKEGVQLASDYSAKKVALMGSLKS